MELESPIPGAKLAQQQRRKRYLKERIKVDDVRDRYDRLTEQLKQQRGVST